MSDQQRTVITIVGSSGGVATALLALLNKVVMDHTNPLYAHLNKSELHLIDSKQKGFEHFSRYCPHLIERMVLHQFDVMKGDEFTNHLQSTKTDLVIDVSWADTVQMLQCCNQLGIMYVNTALENVQVDLDESLEGFTLLERYERFERGKQGLTNTKAIVCSGMNPGIVQWMAIELMKQTPNETPKACYIVENDNSFFVDKSLAKENTLYTTWSTECFLDEALLNLPMFVKHGLPMFLYFPVYQLEYKVSLGDIQFYGSLMAHEEVITLGKLMDMETGFLYKVSDHTTKLIRDHLDNPHQLWDWPQVVLNPSETPLEGSDLVGVLLVYDHCEKFMYNVSSNQAIFSELGINATYYQVACGLFAAIGSLLLDNLPTGVFYVDELLLTIENSYGRYLKHVMPDFVYGENSFSDGLLHKRMVIL